MTFLILETAFVTKKPSASLYLHSIKNKGKRTEAINMSKGNITLFPRMGSIVHLRDLRILQIVEFNIPLNTRSIVIVHYMLHNGNTHLITGIGYKNMTTTYSKEQTIPKKELKLSKV